MEKGWSALDLDLPGWLEDEVLAVLGSACLGAEYRPTSADRGRLVAYFSARPAAAAAAAAVAGLLRREGLDPVAPRVRLRQVGDGRWAERYQAGLRPFALGRRFLIDPAASGADPGDRVGIHLVPGGAFGTGEHPTTRLCVLALERFVRPGTRWADIGCGSGLLAVVARHCGAADVLALDVDPEAVRIAREVVRLNGLAGAVRVERGTHDALDRGAWDGVVANIGASYFVESAAELAARLREGGKLIASGFYEDRRTEARDALIRAGLTEVGESAYEGWSATVFRRGTESVGEGG